MYKLLNFRKWHLVLMISFLLSSLFYICFLLLCIFSFNIFLSGKKRIIKYCYIWNVASFCCFELLKIQFLVTAGNVILCAQLNKAYIFLKKINQTQNKLILPKLCWGKTLMASVNIPRRKYHKKYINLYLKNYVQLIDCFSEKGDISNFYFKSVFDKKSKFEDAENEEH